MRAAVVIALGIAALPPRLAAAGDMPPTDVPAYDRAHVALEATGLVGAADSVRSPDGVENEGTAQVGLAITANLRGPVLGLLVDAQPLSLGIAESHVAAVVGYELPVTGRWRPHLLGEVGVHVVDDIGESFLSSSPVGGDTTVTLPYAGVRAGATVNSRQGFYVRGSVVARVDLRSEQAVVQVRGFCLFCEEPSEPRTERWDIGGTELGLSVGMGWKF